MTRKANKFFALLTVLVLLLTTVSSALASGENELVASVNQLRQWMGKSTLTLDSTLCRVAQLRADEIAQRYGSIRPDGSTLDQLLAISGLKAQQTGENILRGTSYPTTTVLAWLLSSSGCDNMLQSGYSRIGVAHTVVDGTNYWVAVFTDQYSQVNVIQPMNTTVTTVK